MEYKDLNDIRLRKKVLRTDIVKDDQNIKKLWNSLFHNHNETINRNSSPSKKFSVLMNTGASLLDGVILGWKLYRKFKK
jgi:hypothetical protein